MITHVAIVDKNGKVWSLPKPNRHGDVIHTIHFVVGQHAALKILNGHVQGFLENGASFVDRLKAFEIAAKCGQILPPYNPINPKERKGEPDLTPRELVSEDLW